MEREREREIDRTGHMDRKTLEVEMQVRALKPSEGEEVVVHFEVRQ